MKAGTVLRSVLAGVIGIALIVGLFSMTGLSLRQFIDLLMRVKLTLFVGVIVCTFLYVILGAMKWHLIAGIKAPHPFFYTYFTAQAMLIGHFLPLPLAVAFNRAAVMKYKQNVALKKGLLNAVYDMGFDFLVAALLVPISLLQWFYHFGFDIWVMLGIAVLLSAGFLLAHAPKIIPVVWRAKLELPGNKHGLLSKRLIGLMMFLSALRLGLIIGRQALGADAFSLPVSFETVAYVVPPATMSSLLVITPGNLGIAEWSWTYLLTLWGVPATVGAFYSVSFRILLFFAQLIVTGICWLFYTAGKRR